MDLATGAIGSLRPKLVELLKDEYELQKGAKDDVEFLIKELESVHAALRKVANVPRDQLDEQVKIWADDLRDASYAMEDAVDSFLLRVEGSEPAAANPGGLKGLVQRVMDLFNWGKTRHQIAYAIKDIKKQVQEVADRRKRCKVDGVVVNPATTADPRILALYKDPGEIVGIQEATDELIRRLKYGDDDTSNQQLKILSIFGFGGLGKTTLAKAVYDKLRGQFALTAFVPVGQNPDEKKVFKDILLELDKEKYMSRNVATLDQKQLIDELRGLLQNKRYVIVIDDIWDKQAWEIISCAFIDSNNGSRVITTTRIFEVAMKAGDVYKLQPLSPENSEALFYKRLFGGKCKCPYDQPAGVSESFLQKCGGIPLAIITIASLLIGKPREDWSKVYDSIGFGSGDNEHVENTRKILLFSYYDLPCHLRTCLVHLSIFPEDYMIDKDTLIWKWVAEGFVHEEPGIRLFELGERYFNELINRSMIQPVEIPHQGIITGCRVHDLVLDVICLLSKEVNFVAVLDSNVQHTSSKSNARRLALQKRVVEQQDHLGNMGTPQVRSFNATMCHFSMIPLLSSFEALRVLSIEDCTFMEGRRPNHLEHLGRLLQLRHLGVYRTPISELPEEIGDLRFLQTLDLMDTKMSRLPQSIGLLKQLKRLHFNGPHISVSSAWLGNLTSLEELLLDDLRDPSNIVKELGKLTELRKLSSCLYNIPDESSNKALLDSLGNMQKLQVLDLRGEPPRINWEGFVPPRQLRHVNLRARMWRRGGPSSRLPAWINSSLLPNLSHLYAILDNMEAQDVEILGRFPELLALELRILPCVISGGAFPKLRYLKTVTMPRFLPGAMPSLESIEFHIDWRGFRDPNYGSVFVSLGNLTCLQKVTVHDLSLSFQDVHATEMKKAEAELRHTLDIHPNHPVLHLSRDFSRWRVAEECSTIENAL